MQQIATSGGRTFWLLQQPEPVPPAVGFDGRCFPCLIWDSGGDRTVDQRARVVTALIEAGCRYFVCRGEAPGIWEDVADFFASCTDFASHTFSDFAVLVIGGESGAAGRFCSAVRAF